MTQPLQRITSLADLLPGDFMISDMSTAPTRVLVYGGQAILGEYVRIGKFVVGHAGIVTQAQRPSEVWYRAPGDDVTREMPLGWNGAAWPGKLVQAMPSGAEEIELTDRHWRPGVAFFRLPEDYTGQGEDAAAIARAMIGTPYSFGSYAALAAWRWGLKTPRLERWINRRKNPIAIPGSDHNRDSGDFVYSGLPAEAICSVLADQAWSLAGKQVCEGLAHQAVTPGQLAMQLLRHRGLIWGGGGMLTSLP